MKKILFFTFLVSFGFLFIFNIANASFGRSLGGNITSTKAFGIIEAESAGYACPTKGTTLQIKTKNGSEGYYIPWYVRSATRKSISTGQGILLISPNSKTVITCTKNEGDGKISKKTIYLKDIRYYGN